MPIRGLESTKRNLIKVKRAGERAEKKARKSTAYKLLQISKAKAPHQLGMLRASGKVIEQGLKTSVGYNKEYAAYQDRGKRYGGSHKIKNRPGGGETGFLSLTFERNKNQITQFYRSELEKELKLELSRI